MIKNSTIPDFEDNLLLIRKIREVNKRALVFILVRRISEALRLYKEGVDYVILSQVIEGQKVSELIKKINGDKSGIENLKKDYVAYLNSIYHVLY